MESTRVTIQAADSDFIDTLNKSKLRPVVDFDLAADDDDIYAASRATFLPVDNDVLDTLNKTVCEAAQRKREEPRQSVSSKTTRSYASSLVSRSSLATLVDEDLDAELDDIYSVSRASLPPFDKDVLETRNASRREASQFKHEDLNQYISSNATRSYASSTVSRFSVAAHSGEDANLDDVYAASHAGFSPLGREASQCKNEDLNQYVSYNARRSCASSTVSRFSAVAHLGEDMDADRDDVYAASRATFAPLDKDLLDTLNMKVVDKSTAPASLSTLSTARGSSSSMSSSQTSGTELSFSEHRARGGLVEGKFRLRRNREAMLSAHKNDLAHQEFEDTVVKEYERNLQKALEASGRVPKQHKAVARVPRLNEVAEI